MHVAGGTSDVVVAAAGDIACDPNDPSYNGGLGTTTACRMKYTSDLLVNMNPAAVFTLGDNEQSDGALWKFQQSYDPTWGRVKSITHPAVGNHEYGTSGASGYFSYFGTAAGDPSKGYYSFDIGAWHIVVLNGNCDKIGGCGVGSPQEQWLKANLAASPAACTLAYWHQPRFSSGGHGDNLAYDVWWQDLYNAGADVVLNGHDHYYERFAPQTPLGTADQEYGIREFVVGTGGRSHGSFGSIHSTSEVRNSDTFGILKLTLRSDSYDWQFVPESGKQFTDQGTGRCHSSARPQALTVSTLGDSITHGYPYGVNDPLQAVEKTYPSLLQGRLDNQIGAGRYVVVNHGINGLKAEELRTNLQTQGWLNENPAAVLIMIGGNDLSAATSIGEFMRLAQETVREVQDSVNIIKAHVNPDGGRPAVIVSAFPPNRLAVLANQGIIYYNGLLKSQLTGVDLFFSDNFDDLYDSTSGDARPGLMSDTVHPNDAGYALIAENWNTALMQVMGDIFARTHGLGWLREDIPADARVTPVVAAALPTHFDWRQKDGQSWMTSVRNQGGCGSCVAFSAVGALEGQLKIQSNNPSWDVDLSEQYLFSCGGGTCSRGWYTRSALNYLQQYGTPDEACSPYQGQSGSGSCSNSCPDWQSRASKISSWSWVANNPSAVEAALMSGPLVAGFTVYADFYYGYNGGVYHWDHVSQAVGGHAIVIVGYDQPGQYWIVKNSWGASWGENGYFRIGFEEAGIEQSAASMSASVNPSTHTVSFYADPTSGIITADGETKTNGKAGLYASGSRVHVVAAPPDGYLFSRWELNGVSADAPFSPDTYMTVSNSDGALRAVFSPPISAFAANVMDAGAGEVIFAYAATSGLKPQGVSPALYTDWTSIGILVGLANSPQYESQDTDANNPLSVDPGTGRPRATGVTIVAVGGPLVHSVIHWLEKEGGSGGAISPVYFDADGTNQYFRKRMDGTVLASQPYSAPKTYDHFVIYTVVDGAGNTYYVFVGFHYRGTMAAAHKMLQFAQQGEVGSQAVSYQVWRWDDTNGDGLVNSSPWDTYTLIASG
jgi:lysophospholipase L1-like esterase